MLTRKALHRSSVLLRTMSSKAYVVPVDPKNPAGNAAPGVNPASLWSSLPQAQKPAKVGTSHLFYGTPAFDVTALVSLGEGFDSKTGDVRREIVRKAVGSGIKSVKGLGDGVSEAVIDASTDPHAAGKI
jgi:aminopeptidase